MTSQELWEIPKVPDVRQEMQWSTCIIANSSAFIHVNLGNNYVPVAKIDFDCTDVNNTHPKL